MRRCTLIGLLFVSFHVAGDFASDAECPALATLNPCTRHYGTCLPGGHFGGYDCECMVAPNETGKTCQGRIESFNVVTILPEFPMQISPCDHKADVGVCYTYHNCHTIGSLIETGPCNYNSDFAPSESHPCNVGIAYLIDKDCEPYACTIE